MMLNPSPKELSLKKKISECKNEKEKKKLEDELFALVEERFKQIEESPFC